MPVDFNECAATVSLLTPATHAHTHNAATHPCYPTITPPNPLPPPSRSLVWGTSVSGKYSLAITCQHLGVQGSPIEVDCQYPVTVARHSWIASFKDLRAGVASSFRVVACDQAGNRRTRGGEDFEVRVR